MVIRQRLSGEQIERPRVGFLDQFGEHRQVVAQALARRGTRADDDISAATDRVVALGLVAVEPLDPLVPQQPA